MKSYNEWEKELIYKNPMFELFHNESLCFIYAGYSQSELVLQKAYCMLREREKACCTMCPYVEGECAINDKLPRDLTYEEIVEKEK